MDLLTLANATINDKNYEQIRNFILFIKWSDTIIKPRGGFIYNKKFCKYTLSSYNSGDEFDAIVVTGIYNGIHIDTYVYDVMNNVIVMEEDPNQKYAATDGGYIISFWKDTYKWHCHYDPYNHMVFIIQHSSTHFIYVDIEDSGEIEVSADGDVAAFSKNIRNYIHLLKTNVQFIDRFHMVSRRK